MVATSPTGPADILATVTARILDGTHVICGSSVSMTAFGAGVISLLYERAVSDDERSVELEIKTSAHTIHIRPDTRRDSEGASLIVNNVDTVTWLESYPSNLNSDFLTASTAFVALLSSPPFSPPLRSRLIYQAYISFTLAP